MKAFKSAFVGTFLVLFLVSGGFVAGYAVRSGMEGKGDDFPIVRQAYTIIQEHGLKPMPDAPQPEYGMIRGLLEVYGDSYTTFVEPIQHELESETLQGNFGGIGVNIKHDARGYIVLYPYPRGPAEKAGIRDGDRLLVVDDLVVGEETNLDAIRAAIHGPVGKKVGIEFGHPPEYSAQTVRIKREEIPLPSVTWHLDADDARLGVVEVHVVAASTAKEVEQAFFDLESRGASAYVLDLRDNYGGLLTAGVDVARIFLDRGIILEQQYRGEAVETFRVNHPGPLTEMPLVVFVNEHTASAAEIIAGALQANRRAPLLGAPTFGKNTIQLVFDLDDGSSLHVTAARWWVPGTENVKEDGGLKPNIEVQSQSNADKKDTALIMAEKIFFGQ